MSQLSVVNHISLTAVLRLGRENLLGHGYAQLP
jgi:hypothetical protein